MRVNEIAFQTIAQKFFGQLDSELGSALHSGGIFDFGIEFGKNAVTLHYDLTPVSNSTSLEPAEKPWQSGTGGATVFESAFFAASDDARVGGSVHGSLKVARSRYEQWLAFMIASNHAKDAALSK